MAGIDRYRPARVPSLYAACETIWGQAILLENALEVRVLSAIGDFVFPLSVRRKPLGNHAALLLDLLAGNLRFRRLGMDSGLPAI